MWPWDILQIVSCNLSFRSQLRYSESVIFFVIMEYLFSISIFKLLCMEGLTDFENLLQLKNNEDQSFLAQIYVRFYTLKLCQYFLFLKILNFIALVYFFCLTKTKNIKPTI